MIERLNSALNNVKKSGIRTFTAMARQVEGCMFLTLGEPDFNTPDEVKARANAYYGNPEDAVGYRKIRNLIEAADAYLRLNMIDLPCRFDVITITGAASHPYIRHFEQAFRP